MGWKEIVVDERGLETHQVLHDQEIHSNNTFRRFLDFILDLLHTVPRKGGKG